MDNSNKDLPFNRVIFKDLLYKDLLSLSGKLRVCRSINRQVLSLHLKPKLSPVPLLLQQACRLELQAHPLV